jgi:hypothetical protein
MGRKGRTAFRSQAFVQLARRDVVDCRSSNLATKIDARGTEVQHLWNWRLWLVVMAGDVWLGRETTRCSSISSDCAMDGRRE